MAGNVAEFNQSNFEAEVLNSEQPVLVDFWATWCPPCRQIIPVIAQLADDNLGKAKVGKVDVESNRDLAVKYGIQGIPALLVFKNGQVVEKMMGVQSKNRLQQSLDSAAG